MGIVTFSLSMGHAGREIPEWKFRNHRVHCEVTLAALEQLYGPVPDGMLPDRVFASVRANVEEAAQRKIDREGKDFKEPVRIDVDDL